MKLYTTDASPFGARVRIQIYSNNLPIEILPPPGGLGSSELLAISPMGKIPVLDLGHSVIIESEIIQEYLQEKYPQPSLLGSSEELTANIRILSRITDLYLLPALLSFRQVLKDEAGDRKILDEAVSELQKVFGTMEHYMSGDSYAVANKLSLADCCMAPLFFYLLHFSGVLETDLSLENYPRLHTWSENISKDPVVDRVYGEIARGMKPV